MKKNLLFCAVVMSVGIGVSAPTVVARPVIVPHPIVVPRPVVPHPVVPRPVTPVAPKPVVMPRSAPRSHMDIPPRPSNHSGRNYVEHNKALLKPHTTLPVVTQWGKVVTRPMCFKPDVAPMNFIPYNVLFDPYPFYPYHYAIRPIYAYRPVYFQGTNGVWKVKK